MESILRCILIHTHKDRISGPTWTLKEQLRYCLSLLRLRVVYSFGSFFCYCCWAREALECQLLFLHKQFSHFVCPVNDLKRFNYKMTDLGQVSIYSCLPSLGPGTVMGENGKKRVKKAKQKASEAIRAVEWALCLPRLPAARFSRYC